MRIYQQMVDDEKSKSQKPKNSKTNGNTDGSKPRPRGRPKSVVDVEEEEKVKKVTTNGRTAESNGEDLREENQRLKTLVNKYEKETQNIINKASELKRKDTTNILEILELFNLNTYLISHLPDSERILKEYLLKKKGMSSQSMSGQSMSSGSSSSRHKDLTTNSVSKAFKSPIIPISNHFKSGQKSSSDNEVDSKHQNNSSDSDSDDRPLIKSVKKPIGSPKSKKTRSVDESEEKSGRKKERVPPTPRRSSPRKAQKRYVSPESDREGVPDQNETTTSKRSFNRSESKEDNQKSKNKDTTEKPKIKRKRRPRVEERKGLFPCTFDESQCNEIMDTKEHFDFHMGGHYDAKYVCPFCAYTGPTIQIIKRHINKERETALQDAKDGKYLNADKRVHKDIKVYQCFGCKVCDKIHDKTDKKCQHILENEENQCQFMHDMDYEFKDHLKMHFADKFKNMKDSDERKQKIRSIVDKFVEELYFENNAKKGLLIEKFNKTKETERKNESEKKNEKDSQSSDDREKKTADNASSDSDWD